MNEIPLSSSWMRRFTDSLAMSWFTEKCFPMSRRKSMRGRPPSQSWLLAILAGFDVTSKSRKWASCPRIASAFSAAISFVSRRRSAVLPDGSPMRPVPPPTSAIGVWPARWACTSPMIGTRFPRCRLLAVGSKPM